MATLITQISEQTLNYETKTTYTYDLSFTGVQEAIASADVKILIPEFIEFTVGEVQFPIQDVVQEAVAEGTLLTFRFGNIINKGLAVRMTLTVWFKIGTPTGTTYTCRPTLWINGSEYLSTEADTLTLDLVPLFTIKTEKVLPLTEPAVGGAVIMRVTLENIGDKGAEVTDTVISCTMPEGVLLDTTFKIIGEDASANPFKDEREEGREGVIANNGFTFTLPSYKGIKYTFMYQIIVSETFEIGESVEHTVECTIDTQPIQAGVGTLVLAGPTFQGGASKYGPDYTLPEEYISYEIYIINNGNQILPNVEIVDELPPEVEAYECYTGTFWIQAIKRDIEKSYMIEYTTQSGVVGEIGPYNTDNNTRIDLAALTGEGDQIAFLRWKLGDMGIGVRQKAAPTINGIVKADAQVGNSIFNHFDFAWDGPTGRESSDGNQVAIIQDLCTLVPSVKRVGGSGDLKPGDVITLRVRIDCRRSRVHNPRIAVLLPESLDYEGFESLVCYDYFPDKEVFPQPPIRIVEDYGGTGRTLVKLTFEGDSSYNARQRSIITFKFQAKVRIGARGEDTVLAHINTIGGTGVVPNGIGAYRDHLDLAETGVDGLVYAQASYGYMIMFFAGVMCKQYVKGILDDTYTESPGIGNTVQGGLVDYQLQITNVGNADLRSIEIVTILPHQGDTFIVTTSQGRESTFHVYNVNLVEVGYENLTEQQLETAQIQLMYSKSYNPVRFGVDLGMIGVVNDWSSKMPLVATDMRSFKAVSQHVMITPGQTMTMHMQGIAAVGVTPGQIAWQSFAAKVGYQDETGAIQYLLGIEADKVGLQVQDTLPGTGRISGVVFDDVNRDSLLTSGDRGLDDIPIVLYDENYVAIGATFTTPNVDGEDGYYVFNNLPIGRYRVRAIVDTMEDRFVDAALTVANGSKVNDAIGITPIIDLGMQAERDDMHIGMTRRNTEERIDLILEFNKSANKVLRSATYNQLLLGMKLEETKQLIEKN